LHEPANITKKKMKYSTTILLLSLLAAADAISTKSPGKGGMGKGGSMSKSPGKTKSPGKGGMGGRDLGKGKGTKTPGKGKGTKTPGKGKGKKTSAPVTEV
jgi:hypothetical protein